MTAWWALVALATVLSLAGALVAPASGAVSRQATDGLAGLVVVHGDGSRTQAVVSVGDERISGVELLRRSGVELLVIPFGGLGEGVCQIEREGCDVTTCRRNLCQVTRDAPFWQVFDRVAADGAWAAAPLGASASRVAAGQVVLWEFTSGDASVPVLSVPDIIAAGGFADDLDQLGAAGGPIALLSSGQDEVAGDGNTGEVVGGLIGVTAVAALAIAVLARRRLVAS